MARIGILKIGTFNDEGAPNNDWQFIGKKPRNGAMGGWDIRDLQSLKAKADAGEIPFEYDEQNPQLGECLVIKTAEDADAEAESKGEATTTTPAQTTNESGVKGNIKIYKSDEAAEPEQLFKFSAEITGVKGTDKGVEVKLLTPNIDTSILNRVGYECTTIIVIAPLGFSRTTSGSEEQQQLFDEHGEPATTTTETSEDVQQPQTPTTADTSQEATDVTPETEQQAAESEPSTDATTPEATETPAETPTTEYTCTNCGGTLTQAEDDANAWVCKECGMRHVSGDEGESQ